MGGELLVDTVFGPVGFEALLFAIYKPEGDLFDGGIFNVCGKWRLAFGGGGAGEDVAAGVRNAECGVRSAE